MCTPAPSARRALSEASHRWPTRNRASDGICPSAAHSLTNPTSDHERGMAFDLTHDPDHGCDAHYWAAQLMLRHDWRVKYVISNRRIWNPSISPNWREYGGPNPHTKHMHVSLLDTARDDSGPWWEPAQHPAPSAPAPQPPEEESMPAAVVPWLPPNQDGSRPVWTTLPALLPDHVLVVSNNHAPFDPPYSGVGNDSALPDGRWSRLLGPLVGRPASFGFTDDGAVVLVTDVGAAYHVARRP